MTDVINTNYEPEVKQALEEMKEQKEKRDMILNLLEKDLKTLNMMLEDLELRSGLTGDIYVKDVRQFVSEYKKKKQKINDDIMRSVM